MKKNNDLLPVGTENSVSAIKENGQPERTSSLRHTYKTDSGRRGVRSVNISTDNRYLVITYEENTPRIRIMDLQRLEFLPYEYEGHTASVRLTNISPDNKVIHTASWDGSSRRYVIDTGECTLILSGFGRSPSCFLDPGQRYLFTASYDSDCFFGSKNSGRCWDLSSGSLLTLYKHEKERSVLEAMDIVYDEGMVYTGSDDGCLYLWNVEGGQPLKEFFSVEGSVRKLAVSPNYIAAACTDKTVRVHCKRTGDFYRCFSHEESDVRTVLISGDERLIWSATDKGYVYCFNLSGGNLIYRRKVNGLWIWSMALMQNEQIIVTGSGDGCVTFISAGSGKTLANLHNLLRNNNVLITCPPDKNFPQGFFYTTNKDLINVTELDKETGTYSELQFDHPDREIYINKLNLKNLIITRLKSCEYFNSLSSNHSKNNKILKNINTDRLSLALNA